MKTQFQFKQPNVMYKLHKGSGVLISNAKMTDELAVEFLKIDPARIKHFSIYPENWLELVGTEEAEQAEATPEPETPVEVVETAKKGCTSCKKNATNKAKSKTTKG